MSGATYDPWSLDDAANVPVPEPPKTNFADLPDKAYVLVKNATGEQKEGAQPKIEPWTYNGEEKYKFKTAFIVTGGDDKIKPTHAGKYLFFETSVHQNPEKAVAGMPCNGVLYNLMLDTLAPEEGPAAGRWAKALIIMRAKATELGYTTEAFKSDLPLLYATTFAQVLKDKAYTIIGQTYTPKAKPGKTFQPSQTIGSIMAHTVENAVEHKVVVKVAEEVF